MTIKNGIKRVLPERLVIFGSGCLYITAHIHHFLPNCVTLTPLKNLFGVLWGIERVPQGSEDFYPHFFEAVKKTCTRPYFIDVGANAGWFPRIMFRFMPEKYPVYCYEPLRSMQKHLERLRSLHPNINFKSVAVGDKQECTQIIELGVAGLSSIRQLNPSYSGYEKHYDTKVVNKYEVQVVTLNDELDQINKGGEDFVLKIDTQGYELQVLKGASKYLQNGRIKYILVELMTAQKYSGAATYKEIFNYLHDFNYTLFNIYPGVYEGNGMLSEFDAVFVHNSIALGQEMPS